MNKELVRRFSEILTGPSIEDAVNQANKAHVINYSALFMALVDKGILEPTDWEKYKILATHEVDQAWTAKMEENNKEAEELLKELDKEAPGVSKIFGSLFGSMSKGEDDEG